MPGPGEGDNTEQIHRRKAIRRKTIKCKDLTSLQQLVSSNKIPIVEEVKKIFTDVSAEPSSEPSPEERQRLLEQAIAMNKTYKKKREERAEQGAVADEAPSCDTKPTDEEIKEAEFDTKMMDDDHVLELSAMLMERIVEEQTRRKEEADRRDAAAGNGAGNGPARQGGSRKRKHSKKRKGKGNKTRKNAQNNNNNNTTRRRKKTARRRRTKRA